jgi:hypothetical protein
MVDVSYAICVCNEHTELFHLLSFLEKVRNHKNSEIVVQVDTSKVTQQVRDVLGQFTNVRVIENEFKGDFAIHKNNLNDSCKGRLIFNIDADEIPQESLIREVEKIKDGEFDVIYVPRINICPGYTKDFIKEHKFHVNEVGWINWPDYQGRIYPRTSKWIGAVHERIEGSRVKSIQANPEFALWHIKSVEKQNRQNELYKSIQVPDQV